MNPAISIGCDVKPTVTMTGDATKLADYLGFGLVALLSGIGVKFAADGLGVLYKIYTKHKEKMVKLEAHKKTIATLVKPA